MPPYICGTSPSLNRQASTTVPDFGADSDDDMDRGGAKGEEEGAPSSMIVQFATLEGESKGPQIDVPLGSTVVQMEELMNQLLENRDKVWNADLCNIFRSHTTDGCHGRMQRNARMYSSSTDGASVVIESYFLTISKKIDKRKGSQGRVPH